MTANRYEVRPTGRRFGVYDLQVKVWQTVRDTRAEAEAWIADRIEADKRPAPASSMRVAMPARD